MPKTARTAALFLATVLSAAHVNGTAIAADYPTRKIDFIVPWSPGTSIDIVGRFFATRLAADLGQPVAVDNRPGANSVIGSAYVAKGPTDGYTILVTGSSFFINQALVKNAPFDINRDFRPVARLASQQIVLVVGEKSPFNTLADYLNAAKKSPGSVTYGSTGVGSATHLAGAMMANLAGVELRHIPYSSAGQLFAETISGQVASSFQGLPGVTSFIDDKKMKPLGVSRKQRSTRLPNVPTIDSVVPGYETASWTGAFARTGTPEDNIRKLADAMLKISKTPSYAELITQQGLDADFVGPDWDKTIPAELKRWEEVVAKSGATAQ